MTYPSTCVFEGSLRRTQRQPREVGVLSTAGRVCTKEATLRREAMTVVTMITMMMTKRRRAMMTGTGMMRWEGSRSATVLLLGAARRYGEGCLVSTKGAQEEMGLIWRHCSMLTLW